MDILDNEETEKPMPAAYAILADAIRAYDPATLNEDFVRSLRFMLKHENFAPIRDVIADKLIEIGEFFARREERIVKTNLEGKPINKPKRPTDNRKRKKKVSNGGDIPEGNAPSTMDFIQDPKTGLLMPVKK